MRYKIRCKLCGATAWVPGEDDPDTNGCELNLDGVVEWDGCRPDSSCDHADHEVVDQEEYEPNDYDLWRTENAD